MVGNPIITIARNGTRKKEKEIVNDRKRDRKRVDAPREKQGNGKEGKKGKQRRRRLQSTRKAAVMKSGM